MHCLGPLAAIIEKPRDRHDPGVFLIYCRFRCDITDLTGITRPFTPHKKLSTLLNQDLWVPLYDGNEILNCCGCSAAGPANIACLQADRLRTQAVDRLPGG